MSSRAIPIENLAVVGVLAARCADLRKGEGQPCEPRGAIQLKSAVWNNNRAMSLRLNKLL